MPKKNKILFLKRFISSFLTINLIVFQIGIFTSCIEPSSNKNQSINNEWKSETRHSKYLKIYSKLKKINPDIEFSSDFIIAYPGEDENDFKDTLNLIDEVKFINSYSFLFSPRPGTVASDLPIVDKKKSIDRLEIIQQKLFNNQRVMNKSLENTIINVLVENRTEDKSKLFSRSEYMTSVLFSGSDNLIGKIVKVKIQSSNQNTLFGVAIDQSNQKVA